MGGKFKLLSLPCWGSQQPKLQNWNCKEWSRSPQLAPAHRVPGVRMLFNLQENQFLKV